MECMECLKENAKIKRISHFLYTGGRAILIPTGTKLHDTKYTFYGFNDDLIEIIK